MELLKQLDLETRSQSILQRKRENILKLLQRRQAMIEEGTWEKIGGKDRMSHLFSLMGDDSYGFGFSKISLQASPINDIFDWMTQYHPDLLPPGDPFPPSPAPSQATVAEKKGLFLLRHKRNFRTYLMKSQPISERFLPFNDRAIPCTPSSIVPTARKERGWLSCRENFTMRQLNRFRMWLSR